MRNLNVGDKVGIISTARKISFNELNLPIEIIKGWGLQVVLSNNLFCEENQFSGTIKQRSDDLQQMIDDNSIKAIFCARGGYGTVQIVDNIDFTSLRINPKWIVGFSDITVLHSHLNMLGFASIHATMPINFKNNTSKSLDSLMNSLFGIKNQIECLAHPFNQSGRIDAEIVGGNLSVLYSLIGSPSDLNTDGKILLIEDIDEYFYHLDRMMINLKRNGKFSKISGLIVGGMSNMNDNIIKFGKTANEIILEYTKEYNIPTCFSFPAGHIDDNRSIKFGVISTLEISHNGVRLSQS